MTAPPDSSAPAGERAIPPTLEVPGAARPAQVPAPPERPLAPTLTVPGACEPVPSTPPEQSGPVVASGPIHAERYEDLGRIARGGMGDVRRVWDHALGRGLAMKVLPWDHVDSDPGRARFLAEVRITASLQHPGIVPIHEGGELPDGRLWFTMKEVRGRTLRAVIAELHRQGPGGGETPSLRRVLEMFLRVCETVAYAHSRGVVHCDLKPDNVMIGEFGEVLVLDWGVAKIVGVPKSARGPGLDAALGTGPERELAPLLTERDEVLGTPGYMSPEQVGGDPASIGPATDVYALGAVLHEILSGKRPGALTAAPGEGPAWSRILRGVSLPPPPPGVPDELVALTARATARDPAERFADARRLAEGVRSWLDGAARRERALALVAEAEAIRPRIVELQARARALGEKARDVLAALRPYAPVSDKAPGWRLLEEQAELERQASLEEVAWMQALRAALSEVPELPEAHDALASHYKERLLAAEARRDARAAARHEALLRAHDRGQHAAFLQGDGRLSVVTEPAGAEVTLHRYRERDRRLVAERVAELGPTPLRDVPLPRGSYLLTVRAPGCEPVAYPVALGRSEHWDGVRPGDAEPTPLRLPRAGELGPGEVLVPAGYFVAGGDPDAPESLPRRRLWADAFVVQRDPVTVAEYLAFLNALVAAGRGDEALEACPRVSLARGARGADALAYARDAAGRFVPRPDAEAEDPACPVVFVDCRSAERYAGWLAAESGKAWRLLNELEWEKAARGVDGRFMPWGDFVEPTWACVIGTGADVPRRTRIDAYPTDVSPYGVRGMAGNVHDWCSDEWREDGPDTPGGIVRVEAATRGDADLRVARGGSSVTAAFRLAVRFASRPTDRFTSLGFRLARSVR
ncbi:MAG: SUMF1/EgtB/PvdO family nonheme iron enzyme [Polyangiaceae bacterium]|nr:SUMF1/EgtB/PvdO family nonheme iron enzyme [Polyangiaceae bacterium]